MGERLLEVLKSARRSPAWMREGGDPKHLAQIERVLEGLRIVGLPEQ